MTEEYLLDAIEKNDTIFSGGKASDFVLPIFDPNTHYTELTCSGYFRALIILRHFIKLASDVYWADIHGSYNVDLFMMTSSVSSPMGPGSDSEAIAITFGDYHTYLVDSSQFGFEPLIMNGFKSVYCYLPSMRGEDPDARHLNQFYHCEAEIQGEIETLYPSIEGYVRFLAQSLLSMPNILRLISLDVDRSTTVLKKIVVEESFKRITFKQAIAMLEKEGHSDLINYTAHGADISSRGELQLMQLLKTELPVWVTHYDRDRVPFYQKPNPENLDEVVNADLIFPPIIEGAFGGEVVGCGQRQDNIAEMHTSLKRQGLNAEPYEWYINLRTLENYQTTSGFGMGIERFVTWALGRDNIRDAILYPRLKNVLTHP